MMQCTLNLLFTLLILFASSTEPFNPAPPTSMLGFGRCPPPQLLSPPSLGTLCSIPYKLERQISVQHLSMRPSVPLFVGPATSSALRPLASRIRMSAEPKISTDPNGLGAEDLRAEDARVSSALEDLRELTLKTIRVSWTNMEKRLDSDMSRSASGGTTWADGGWVDPQLQIELKTLMNRTVTRADSWQWLKAASEPFQVEILNTDEADVNLLFIPPGCSTLPWRRPTGTKVLSKALFGECEVIQMLGDPNGRNPMRPATRSKIDSNDILLYLGGPPRVYGEASMLHPCCILEVSLNSKPGMNMLGGVSLKGFVTDAVGYEEDRNVLKMKLSQDFVRTLICYEEEQFEFKTSLASNQKGLDVGDIDILEQFDPAVLWSGVGGLDTELQAIIRRAFLTRRLPQGTVESLGLEHVSGILLHGPPGCGKTLIARLISKAMTQREAIIVNGPEVLDKWVGEAERNVRALFFDAELEWIQRGRDSAIHVIVLDELDSFCRARGSLRGDTSGVRDSVVNQLLAKMDGVNKVENVIIIGLTNRKDLIDPALLRPGRLEVHVEIKPPDAEGRKQILDIHLRKMKESGRLTPEALKWADSEPLDSQMDGLTGAEIAGLVRSATSFAVQRALAGDGTVSVTDKDLEESLIEVMKAKAGTRKGLRAWLSR